MKVLKPLLPVVWYWISTPVLQTIQPSLPAANIQISSLLSPASEQPSYLNRDPVATDVTG